MACLRWSAALIAALSLFASAPAAAQGGDAQQIDPAVAELARQHFERGTRAFEVGDYEAAVEAFTAAYELTPHPDILYNIYSAEERAGNLEAARDALAAHLEQTSPEQERRTDLEARLARLETRLAERRAERAEARAREAELRAQASAGAPGGGLDEREQRAQPDSVEPAPAPPSGGGVHPAAIASLVVAGVGLVSFAVFAGLSEAEDQRLASTCGRDVPEATCGDVTALEVYNVVADASWITAAVAAALGLALLFTLEEDGGDASASLQLTPFASVGGGGVAAAGAF